MKGKWMTRALLVGCALLCAAPAADGGGCGKPTPPPEHDDDLGDALDELRDADHARAVRLRRAIRDVVDREVCAATPLLAVIVMNERLDTMTRSMAALGLGELACHVGRPGSADDDTASPDEHDEHCPEMDVRGHGPEVGEDFADEDDGMEEAEQDEDEEDSDLDGRDNEDADIDEGEDRDDRVDEDDDVDERDDDRDTDEGYAPTSGAADEPHPCRRDRWPSPADDWDMEEAVRPDGRLHPPFREESGLGRFEIGVLKEATALESPLGLRQSAARALGRAHVTSAVTRLTAIRDRADEDAALRFVAAQSLTRITGRDHFDVAFRDDLVDRYIEDASGYELVEAE